MKSGTAPKVGRLPSFEGTASARGQFSCSSVTPAHVAAILSLPCPGFEVIARRFALCSSVAFRIPRTHSSFDEGVL
jgi:hypothetical protein